MTHTRPGDTDGLALQRDGAMITEEVAEPMLTDPTEVGQLDAHRAQAHALSHNHFLPLLYVAG